MNSFYDPLKTILEDDLSATFPCRIMGGVLVTRLQISAQPM
jgi:hypothetical protein